jgi:hypothetical protein
VPAFRPFSHHPSFFSFFLHSKILTFCYSFHPLQLITPRSGETVTATVLSQLFVELCLDSLNKFTYSATIAGLHFQFYIVPLGFVLKVKGLNDKLPHLLYKIVDQISNLEVSPERFEITKDKVGGQTSLSLFFTTSPSLFFSLLHYACSPVSKLRRQYQSWKLMGPFEWAKYRAGSVLSKVWEFDSILETIEKGKCNFA